MNISHIIKPSGIGGIENMLKGILKYQIKDKRINPSVFAIVEDCYKNSFVEYINFPNMTLASDEFKKCRESWNLHVERYGNPDIIHSHHHNNTNFIKKMNFEQKIVATIHWTYTNSNQYQFYNALILNSEWQLKNIPNSYFGKTFLLNNFFNKLDNKKDSSFYYNLRKKFNIKKNDFVFGAVGRLTYQKGFDTLCRAFNKANINNCKLLIVGDSNIESEKNEIIKSANNNKNIVFTGFYNNPSDLFYIFDCFILPSRFESFGLVLTEAMSIGLPCIITNSYGPLDISNNQRHGIKIFNIDDEENLSVLIYEAYKEGRKKYKYYLDKYNYIYYNKKLLNIYEDILK